MLAHLRRDKKKRHLKELNYPTNLRNDSVNNAVTFLSEASPYNKTTHVYSTGNL
jgi:hypothetical protein